MMMPLQHPPKSQRRHQLKSQLRRRPRNLLRNLLQNHRAMVPAVPMSPQRRRELVILKLM